jgi:hypothetical protein
MYPVRTVFAEVTVYGLDILQNFRHGRLPCRVFLVRRDGNRADEEVLRAWNTIIAGTNPDSSPGSVVITRLLSPMLDHEIERWPALPSIPVEILESVKLLRSARVKSARMLLQLVGALQGELQDNA